MNLFCSITSKALPLCCWSISHCRKLTTWHPSHDVLSLQTSSYWNVLLCNELRSWSLSSSPIVSLRVGPHSEWIKLYRTICSAHWLQPSHSLCLLSSQLTTSPVTPCQAPLSPGLFCRCVFWIVRKLSGWLTVDHDEMAHLPHFKHYPSNVGPWVIYHQVLGEHRPLMPKSYLPFLSLLSSPMIHRPWPLI